MTNGKIVWLLFIVTTILLISLRWQNRYLVTPSSPEGILSLEFSKTAEKTEMIKNEWSVETEMIFYFHIILDYFFILFYGLFFYFTSLYISMIFPNLKRLGKIAILSGLLAAGLDAIENVFMLFSVSIKSFDFVSFLTAVISGAKFLFAGMAILFILIGGIKGLLRKTGN
jgi:hypothetical protein